MKQTINFLGVRARTVHARRLGAMIALAAVLVGIAVGSSAVAGSEAVHLDPANRFRTASMACFRG